MTHLFSNMIKNFVYAKHILRKNAKIKYVSMIQVIISKYGFPKRRRRSI
jgi:hypothetical protein